MLTFDVLMAHQDVADANRRTVELERAAAADRQRVAERLAASLVLIERSREILSTLERQH
jgi:hypothetical protein